MSLDLRKKNISILLCQHGNTFRRRYNPLKICNAKKLKNLTKWSSTFSFLIDLYCLILNCDQRKVYILSSQIKKWKYENSAKSYKRTEKRKLIKRKLNDTRSNPSDISDTNESLIMTMTLNYSIKRLNDESY